MQEQIATNRPEWKPILEKQGLLLTPRSKFQDLGWLPFESRSADRLTGLPLFNNETRSILVNEFTKCLRNNRKWACLNIDADQLKTANDKYERSFGDAYINWEAATVTRIVEDNQLTKEVVVRMIRPSYAADEIIVWFFNLADEDIQKIEKIQKSIGEPISIPQLSFTFSLSTGLLKSDDQAIKESLSSTQKWLLSNPKAQAFDLFQQIEDKTNELSKVEKIAKDLHRLPLVELMKQQNIDALINVMRNNLGGSRISDHLLELILKLQSVHTLRLLSNKLDCETYTNMLRKLGVKTDDLNNVESPEALVKLFRELFGEKQLA